MRHKDLKKQFSVILSVAIMMGFGGVVDNRIHNS